MEDKILVVGDLHGEWELLNRLINKKQPDIILQCGDFGYWPKQSGTTLLSPTRIGFSGQPLPKKKWFLDGIKNHNCKIYWCDGNHEDHWELKKVTNTEILPNVFYMPRGSVLTLPDGRNVLFMGGAESTDRHVRTIGFDWFPEETITQTDLHDLPDKKVDIVISHTCPEEFLYGLTLSAKFYDPSIKALSYILERYKPMQWFFGHFHCRKEGFAKGCYWTCLNMANRSGWHHKISLHQ